MWRCRCRVFVVLDRVRALRDDGIVLVGWSSEDEWCDISGDDVRLTLQPTQGWFGSGLLSIRYLSQHSWVKVMRSRLRFGTCRDMDG